MRRACRRGYVEHVGEVVLEEVDPCRTAGGKDRQADGLVALEVTGQAVQYLGSFFHDGEVGGKVRVEHVVETQFAQGIYHLARHQCAGGQIELFAQGGSYGRCRLHNDHFVWIGKVLE